MKHFTDEAWVDFARHLLPAEETSRMQAHLDSGCAACAETSALWQAVYKIASRQSDYEPGESAVMAVKAAYGARLWELASTFETAMARLVFDSFVNTAMAGIRSISATARHLLYYSGSWTIDIRVDMEAGRRMVIVGQLLQAQAESGSIPQGEVVLMRGETTLAQTSTNVFGEFQFECDCGTDLRIRLEIGGQQPVTMNLPD